MITTMNHPQDSSKSGNFVEISLEESPPEPKVALSRNSTIGKSQPNDYRCSMNCSKTGVGVGIGVVAVLILIAIFVKIIT